MWTSILTFLANMLPAFLQPINEAIGKVVDGFGVIFLNDVKIADIKRRAHCIYRNCEKHPNLNVLQQVQLEFEREIPDDKIIMIADTISTLLKPQGLTTSPKPN